MLTVSDTRFATQASVSERARTLTGSTSTGIVSVSTGVPPKTSKTMRVAAAVLTASSVSPLGVRSSGCTCGVS